MSNDTEAAENTEWASGPNNQYSLWFQSIRLLALAIPNIIIYLVIRFILIRDPLDTYDFSLIGLVIAIHILQVAIESRGISNSQFELTQKHLRVKSNRNNRIALLNSSDIKFIKTYGKKPNFLLVHPTKDGIKKLVSARIKHPLLIFADAPELTKLVQIMRSNLDVRFSGTNQHTAKAELQNNE